MSRAYEFDVRTIARMATARAPAIAPARWELEPDRLALAPTLAIDPSAWIQLGATVEALTISAAANGYSLALDADNAISVAEGTVSRSMERLLDCLQHASDGAFRSEPLRLAPHVSARLVAAAATHASTLVWVDSEVAIEEVLMLLAPYAPPPPLGATALGILRAPRGLDRNGYVRAGRAACRVWLEAASLGLAVLSIAPSWLGAASPLADYDRDDTAVDVAILWFGAAA